MFDPNQNPYAPPGQRPNPLLPPGWVPPPPPPMSPSVGFQAWASDPQNAVKVSHAMVSPDQPLQPNAGAQPKQLASWNPPPTAAQQRMNAAVTPPGGFPAQQQQPPAGNISLPSGPSPAFPVSARPTVSAAPPATYEQDAAANPGKYAKPIVNGKTGAILEAIVAGLAGAAGGLKDDPTAGVKYVEGVRAHDEGVPAQNQALYQSTVVDPRQAVLNQGRQDRQSQAQLADTQSQTEERAAQGRRYDAQADSAAPVVLSPQDAAAIGHPELAGESMPPRAISLMMAGKQKNDTTLEVGAAHDAVRTSIASMKPKERDDQYISIMSKPANQRTPDDLAFKQGYEAMINTKTTQPGIARATAMGNARPVQTVDPNTNNVVYQTAGNAIKSGAATPQSADYAAGKSLEKSFTSGDGAKNLNAFNTASAHLQTLGKAAEALHNGDTQGLNRIGNEWTKQTGGAAPQNFQAVKSAVAGEVSKTFKGGQATDAEIREFNDAISSASSPAQLRGVISTYQDLMDSKRSALQQQYEQGRQGRPNFGNPSAGPQPHPFTPPATQGQSDTPPPAALSRLQEGVQHTFNNGQVWTLQSGKPTRVK